MATLRAIAGRVLETRLGQVLADGLRSEPAISSDPFVQLLLVHLLDGPAADLQALGQLPLAHSLRPLHPDVLPLLPGQARPTAG